MDDLYTIPPIHTHLHEFVETCFQTLLTWLEAERLIAMW